MAISYITALRNAKMTAVNTAIGASAQLIIYSGTVPASANAALSGNTALVTLNCNSSGFGAVATGVLTAGAITANNAAASGTATFFRLLTSGAAVQAQGTVGTTAADLIFNTTTITSGQAVSISSFTLTDNNP